MRIFIPSKNRAQTISTHKYFEGCDYWVVVHDEQQREEYEKHAEETGLDIMKILVSDTKSDQFGLTRQREWVCKDIAFKDEWFLFADDNVKTIEAVHESKYAEEVLPVQADPGLRPLYETECNVERFFGTIIPECVAKAENLGARHVGFATVDNFFFRANHWKEVGYIIGKMMLWHNTGELKFDHTVTMEDYELTAQSLLKFGVALVNNYVFPVAKHYQKGGMGTMEERLPARTQDVAILLARYPGLLRNKKPDGQNPDLALRFHSRTQVEQWRRQMKMISGNLWKE